MEIQLGSLITLYISVINGDPTRIPFNIRKNPKKINNIIGKAVKYPLVHNAFQ